MSRKGHYSGGGTIIGARDRHLLFVGCTRARDRLMVTGLNQRPNFYRTCAAMLASGLRGRSSRTGGVIPLLFFRSLKPLLDKGACSEKNLWHRGWNENRLNTDTATGAQSSC
jgi:hypothetical protein